MHSSLMFADILVRYEFFRFVPHQLSESCLAVTDFGINASGGLQVTTDTESMNACLIGKVSDAQRRQTT